jgi:hypothetical protein
MLLEGSFQFRRFPYFVKYNPRFSKIFRGKVFQRFSKAIIADALRRRHQNVMLVMLVEWKDLEVLTSYGVQFKIDC